MKKTNLHFYSIKKKYLTLYQRLKKSLENGSFQHFSQLKKESILRRLSRYERRLQRLGIAVATASALFLSPMLLNAQTLPSSGEIPVNTYTTSAQYFSSVAMDSDGDFVVVWGSNGQDGSSNGIYAQRYDNTGAANGGEFLVNSYTTSSQDNPSVAMDSDGDFVVVWNSNGQDGSGAGIYAQRYDNTGAANGGEFLVNSYTTYAQVESSITMDSDGDFVVAWASSDDQDGSFYGIYAQLNQPIPLPVELVRFIANPQDNQTTRLDWQTATEINNEGFEVQRSTDGNDWETLGFVNGEGTSAFLQNYSYTDRAPNQGINYYRLKQMDFDGKFEYSAIASVLFESQNGDIAIYPNPVQNEVILTATEKVNAVLIYNTLGQLVKQIASEAKDLTISMEDLSDGMYSVQVVQGDGTVLTKQVLKEGK